MIKAILSRRSNGLYLLTYERPVLCEIGSSGRFDLYAVPGDPLNYPTICEWAAENIFGVTDLAPLHSVEVKFGGKSRGSTFNVSS